MIYCTNGYGHVLWDDASGYPPRPVAGFHTRAELELMIDRRSTRQALAGAPVDTAIVERAHQIRAVGAAFDARQRRALLMMATGAGKTRTVIALVDQLMRAGWVKRVLFLADTAHLRQISTGWVDPSGISPRYDGTAVPDTVDAVARAT